MFRRSRSLPAGRDGDLHNPLSEERPGGPSQVPHQTRPGSHQVRRGHPHPGAAGGLGQVSPHQVRSVRRRSRCDFVLSRPVCLPSPEDLDLELTNRTGTATGWGRDSLIYEETTCGYTKGVPDNKDPPSHLKKIKLK